MTCSVCGSQMVAVDEVDYGQGRVTIEYQCAICGTEDWSDKYRPDPDKDEIGD